MARTAKPLSNTEISFFCNHLAMILHAGMSLTEGISIMLEDSAASEEKDILSDILNHLSESGNLYESLKATDLFPVYMLQMIKIGEETGKLDNVMSSLSVHYEREESIHVSLRHAITYPLIMVTMIFLVIFVLLVKVMPVFNQVFIQLGSEMSGLPAFLINLGNGMQYYSYILIATVFLSALVLVFFTHTEKGRFFMIRLFHRFPPTAAIYEKVAVCKFASGMALALDSGLNPERALELVAALNQDIVFQKKLESCKAKMADGQDASHALLSSGIFTGLYARMAALGIKTGTMDQTMQRIANAYQDDIDTSINNSIAVIEPTLIIVLSLIVGGILLSFMFPLIGIMSSI